LHEDIENDKAERREATVEKDYEYEDNASQEHVGDDTFNSSSTDEDLSQEEQMKMFEKRIIYMVLTLQTVYYSSEAAAEFVVSKLPEVQADLNRVLPAYDPNCIQDTYDGMFARYHSNFSSSTYLKIELNSDDLT
ncbi:unnamed protein product, partial [Rotaria magnacalcarata]